MAVNQQRSGSPILADEYYESEDPRFVDELRHLHSLNNSLSIAHRWKRDRRPWARERIFEYLEYPLDAPEHQPIVKRLFKQAEENRDDELV